MKKRLFVLICLVCMFCITGCGNKIKDEEEILTDLENSSTFYMEESSILDDITIIKRQTNEAEKTDIIYVETNITNEKYNETQAYVMYYIEYNDGWKLESIEEYYGDDVERKVIPTKAPTHEEIASVVINHSNSLIDFSREEYAFLATDLYFFEDGTYEYEITDEVVDIENSYYECAFNVNRTFELVSVQESIYVGLYFDSYTYAWELNFYNRIDNTCEWNIEGIWKSESSNVAIEFGVCDNNPEYPTIPMTIYSSDAFFGSEIKQNEVFELGKINSEEIWQSNFFSDNYEYIIITPNHIIFNEESMYKQ